MLKVALVGHSQIPCSLKVEGAEIELYRLPGAKTHSFENKAKLNQVLNWSGDLVILWLGSNDIDQNTDISEVVKNIIQIKSQIEKECKAVVAIILVEPRCYPNDHPVSKDQYKKIQKGINRKLERALPNTQFLQFNTFVYEKELARDGVHFSEEGKEMIKDKISECIEQHM